MYIFDIESVDIESTAAILSLACTHVTDETDDYQKMLDNSIFIKFDLKEQLSNGRTSGKSTLEWWDRQAEIVKNTSLYPSKNDISVKEGYDLFGKWLSKHGFNKTDVIFARGSLDSICFESLLRTFDLEPIIRYNQWMDIRTAISMMYDDSKYGYVDVDHQTFDLTMVVKHNPVHDCAYDAMMLKYGK